MSAPDSDRPPALRAPVSPVRRTLDRVEEDKARFKARFAKDPRFGLWVAGDVSGSLDDPTNRATEAGGFEA